MIIKAEQKYIRTSARKLRLIVEAIKGLPPEEALQQLRFMRKRAAEPVRKTIQQALANAVNNNALSRENLRFAAIEVGEGSTFKRWRAVSRGRAHPVMKRTAHIKVLLQVMAPKPEGVAGKEKTGLKERSQPAPTERLRGKAKPAEVGGRTGRKPRRQLRRTNVGKKTAQARERSEESWDRR